MLDRKMIVAVDDSNVVIKNLETLLSGNYEFRGFTNGTRALKFLTLMVPDLIILDIDMPEMDGFEVLKMIKDKFELKKVPVLFLTANGEMDHVKKAFVAGANDYCVKPFEPEILIKKIYTLLEGKQKKRKVSWERI